MMHPMQYQLEQAHHEQCERSAEARRLVAQAEARMSDASPVGRSVERFVARVRTFGRSLEFSGERR